MALRLVPADDAPAQGGQHQPPVKRHAIDGSPAGLLVGPQEARRCCRGPRRPGSPERRTATPGCRTTPGLRTPRRRVPAPSRGRRQGRIRRRSGFPSGNRRAPEPGATAVAGGRPASETPTRKWRWCHPWRRGAARHSASWSSRARAGVVGVGAVDGGQRLRALAQQPRAARLSITGVELTLDAPHDGLALDLIADQKRIAQCGRRIVGDQDVRDGCAGRRGGGLGAGFEFHAGVDVVGRPGAQDQRPALPRR